MHDTNYPSAIKANLFQKQNSTSWVVMVPKRTFKCDKMIEKGQAS